MADKKGGRKSRNKVPGPGRKPRAPYRPASGSHLSGKFTAAGELAGKISSFRQAARTGDLKAVETFLQRYHMHVDHRDSHGNTPLFEAARWGDAAMVALLISYGADPDQKNGEGQTALMKAAEKNRPDVVQALIKGGANLNLTDRDGETALVLAAWNDHVDICRLLLEAGASLEVGKGALSPFDVVSRFEYDALAKLFQQYKLLREDEASANQSAGVLEQLRRRKKSALLKKRDDKPKP